MKLTATFRYYQNDYCKRDVQKMFYSLESLKSFLLQEMKRLGPSVTSCWWKNPAGTFADKAGVYRGWFDVIGIQGNDSFWLKEVITEENKIVFVENQYCSPKFSAFLKEVHEEIENNKPVYGEL